MYPRSPLRIVSYITYDIGDDTKHAAISAVGQFLQQWRNL